MEKKTVGAIVSELSQKQPETLDPIEIQRATEQDYIKNLTEAVDRGYQRYKTSFFIEVQTKDEKILQNTFRLYFIDRKSCPTPNYDQTVYRFNYEKGQIEYIWTVPDRETCFHLLEHANEVVKEEQELLKYIIKFANGSLFMISKQYNNEKLETPELAKKDLTFSYDQTLS